jgi:uncharacterized protein (TIGR01777 family)
MKILITGATGLVGKELGKTLSNQGHEIWVVSRSAEKANLACPFQALAIECDLQNSILPESATSSIDAVIHLMGENVGDGRWNLERKTKILNSRIKSSQNLIQSFKKNPPKIIISASATGFYGDTKDALITESQPNGNDFLADVCVKWEKVFLDAKATAEFQNTRFAQIRTGLVLSDQGGALLKMIPPFQGGLGGALGSGKQWMSWIHLEDLINLITWTLSTDSAQGPLNAVSPRPVTNFEFSTELAGQFKKRLGPKAPEIILKTALGEMSTLVLSSQRVSSQKVQDLGFKFKFQTLNEALKDLTKDFQDGHQVFTAQQFLPFPRERVFRFFCQAENLEKITPPLLEFHIQKISTPQIQQGTLIDYKLKIHGIPVHWQSLIEKWEPPFIFVDTQTKGPYRVWHHTHSFHEVQGGTLIKDRVRYKLPLGLVGFAVAGWFIEKDITQIFSHRRKVVAQEKF